MAMSLSSGVTVSANYFRRIDFGLVFTLAMCSFAIMPVLAYRGLFLGHDTMNHIFRVAEVDRIWMQGVLLPRWAETFYSGYGSPVFQYYASLTYYICGLLMRLFGLDALGSLRLLVVLCLPAAGAGMYLFTREQSGRLGGILAALVYVYSPYLVFTEPVTRGDYPELVCYTLFPWVMWRFGRLIQTGNGWDFAWAALFLAPFSLSHNLMSLVLFALLFGWLAWQKVVRLIEWRRLWIALLAAGIGIGITAFFWLPVFLERDEVHLDNVPENIQSEQRHFFGFFVPLDRLLAPSALTDAGAANGIVLRLNLGVAQWGLAVTGVGCAWLRRRKGTHSKLRGNETASGSLEANRVLSRALSDSIYYGAAALVMIALMLPLSYPVWANVTALNFMEFPWRLLGPVVFCLAVLAGMNTAWMAVLPRRIRQAATIGMIALPIVLALPTLYVPAERVSELDTSQGGYLQAELSGRVSPGTSARNDFLPRAVLVLPGATQSLLDDYADGYPVNKVNLELIPAGSKVEVVEHTAHLEVWQVETDEPFTLETFTFYFAGWQAEIDGERVPITPSQPHGFITIPIPAGDHTVRLFLGQTPARYLGIGVSLVAVGALIGLAIHLHRRASYNASLRGELPTPSPIQLPVYLASGMVTLMAVVLLMREGTAWIHSPPGEARIAGHPIRYSFGQDIELLGYDVSSEVVRPGDWLEVTLYWYAHRPADYNYSSFMHFSDGLVPLAQADKPLPGGRLTSEWQPDAYLRDSYTLHIPADTPPGGGYNLNLGLYTCETLPVGECGNGDRLTVSDADGNTAGDILHLATVTVR